MKENNKKKESPKDLEMNLIRKLSLKAQYFQDKEECSKIKVIQFLCWFVFVFFN